MLVKIKKNILFTFDYELFLGKRSGSVDNCLIKPTDLLTAIFKKYEIKHTVFFVDTVYFTRLSELAQTNPVAKEDWNKIKKQLQDLLKLGHYLFPHIHPHWLNAVYLDELNQWDLSDNHRYRFHTLTPIDKEVVFRKSFQILQEITSPFFESYPIDSYRAGGWCIQPFEDFKPFFQHYKIKNDFSVLPMMENFSEFQYYDFTNVPEKNVYCFENDVSIEKGNGNFVEYSISSIPISSLTKFLNRVWLKYLWNTNNKSIGDGLSAESNLLSDDLPLAREGTQHYELPSIELMNSITLFSFLNHLKQNNYLHFISHPKMFSRHNIHIFEKFCRKIFSNYEVETDFRKIII